MAKQKTEGGILGGIFAYSGKGDAARKAYTESLTDVTDTTPQEPKKQPTEADHKRGYTKEPWE